MALGSSLAHIGIVILLRHTSGETYEVGDIVAPEVNPALHVIHISKRDDWAAATSQRNRELEVKTERKETPSQAAEE